MQWRYKAESAFRNYVLVTIELSGPLAASRPVPDRKIFIKRDVLINGCRHMRGSVKRPTLQPLGTPAFEVLHVPQAQTTSSGAI